MAESPMTPFHQMAGKSPEEAKFFWSGGPVEVAPRTWFQSTAARWDSTLPAAEAFRRASREIGWPELKSDAVWLQSERSHP
jgi:hypothetical protein